MNEVSKICYVMAGGALVAPLVTLCLLDTNYAQSVMEWGAVFGFVFFGVTFQLLGFLEPREK